MFKSVGWRDSLATINQKLFKPIIKPIVEFPRQHSTGYQFSRFGMFKQLEGVALTLGIPPGGEHLSISRSQHLIAILGLSGEIIDCSYPDFDLCNLSLPSFKFDSIVSDQVLEHLHGDPFDAMRESARVLKKGGLVVHTTCFFQGFHPKPFDHWRFTMQGMQRLAESAGLHVINVGGHGNFLMQKALRSKWLWKTEVSGSRFNPLSKLLLRNNPERPIYVWIIARK